jgi:hypothetical protein
MTTVHPRVVDFNIFLDLKIDLRITFLRQADNSIPPSFTTLKIKRHPRLVSTHRPGQFKALSIVRLVFHFVTFITYLLNLFSVGVTRSKTSDVGI